MGSRKLVGISILLLIFHTHSLPQSCDFYDDYSDDTGWNYFYDVPPGSGACIPQTQTGSLTITGSAMNYSACIDANDTRWYKDLGFTLSDEAWTATFDVNIGTLGVAGDAARADHEVFALTAGTLSPFNGGATLCDVDNQDGIMVHFATSYYPTPSTTGFYLTVKDGTSYTTAPVIVCTAGSTYYLTLNRFMSTYVSLYVYSDPERTDLVGSVECYEIPSTVTGLHVLQHANLPQGSWLRALTGWVDNSCIKNGYVYPLGVFGISSICSPETGAGYYITNTNGLPVTWSLPAGVSYTSFGDSIFISDWGGTGTFNVQADVGTACFDTTLHIVVDIGDSTEVTETQTICNGDTAYIFGVPETEAGMYSQTFTTASGCDSTNTVNLEVIDSIISTETVSICEGDTAYIYGVPETEAGIYSQYFVSQGGCDSIHEVILNISTISVEFPYDTIYLGTFPEILNPIISGTPVSYTWNPTFGLNCPSCPNPSVYPNDNSLYTLIVTDANGCKAEDSVWIILQSLGLTVPNAFSPNGDGINDFFNILHTQDCTIDLFRIYDRWGQIVFESHDINKGWDGTYNGVAQEIGVYVYVIEGICSNHRAVLAGNVTLIR